MPATSLRQRCTALAVCAAAVLAMLASGGHAAQPAEDDSSLPETLRRGYQAPVDGPAEDTAYARGKLGLIRPGYGRASLFVAWRVMQLPVGAVARESHQRQGSWLQGGATAAPAAGEEETAAWLKARGELVPQAPLVAPDYFRPQKLKVSGFGDINIQVGQCGHEAYAFATRTLRELITDATLNDSDRRAWIAGQDAVFARCVWAPGQTPPPPLPAPLPANAPMKLKALNAYQHAAALFYGDDFVSARAEFDAIAAQPGHPMRPWATLAALRCLVRAAVRDTEWDAAVADAWTGRKLRGAEYRAAMAEPAARHNARVDAALREFDTRMKAALADASLAPVHAAIKFTARRALVQLLPSFPLGMAMNALDRPDYNPYTMGALDLFQELYPRVAPDRPEGPQGAALRQHAWFDFIVTVQACADTSQAAQAGACDREHAHALARWQETRHNTWLLASLMTARQPAASDLPAAEAARAVPADRPEWASLQLYAARVLRAQGRGAEARAAVDALAASPVVHKRDRVLVEAERRAL